MSQFKVHTKCPRVNLTGGVSGIVETDGTRITFCGQKVEFARAPDLVRTETGYWELVLRIAVDPATLFTTEEPPK